MTETGDEYARQAAQELWSQPAGTNLAAAKPGSPEFFEQMTATRYAAQPWHPALLRRFNPTGYLLEIGCGAGTDHAMLASMAANTAAVDLAQEGVDLTNARLQLEGRPGRAQVADAEALPFPDVTFDEVYSFGVIHHTDHPERVAAEMYRVMNPGARFLVALYHQWSLQAFSLMARYALGGWRGGRTWRSFLARVEYRGDDVENPPIVRLYSRRAAARLFRAAGFHDVRTETVHPWLRGRFWPTRGHGGWYVIVTGRR